jgi:CheY-like chemotaxis protein
MAQDMSVTERMVSISRDKAEPPQPRGRILIVEDESFVAIDDQLTLESAGFETIGVVATAEEAIAVAERERPDLVLMDVHLAGSLNGIDAAVQIFERCAIRVLFATAHVDGRTKAQADRARPLGWLTKPFNANDLVSAVERGMKKTKQSIAR